MAVFSVAAVFSNHMVLQRNKLISIFGYGEGGQKINVKLFNSKNEVLAENNTVSCNGRWEVKLTAQSAMTGCTLQIDGPEKISFTDVAIGEVWLAGGQSNMEFELQNCTEGPNILRQAQHSDPSTSSGTDKAPNVRFYYTNKIGWMDEAFYEAEKNTSWQTWDSEWKKSWSAVGYFFAKIWRIFSNGYIFDLCM